MSLNIKCLKSMNFGDGVNQRFWRILTGSDVHFDNKTKHYITTGSIMCFVETESIIFGTGFISKDGDLGGKNFKSNKNAKYTNPIKVIAVRGPLSRKKLQQFNVECPENYGDPLILMPCIYNLRKKVNEAIVGIIPHYKDKKNKNLEQLKMNLEKKGYHVKEIDIEIGCYYKKLIDEINECKYIISSSLHGIIMGVVYEKISIFVEFSDNVIGKGFKFQDFFQSIKINYETKNIYNENLLENKINVDQTELVKTGLSLINLIPFINNKRKEKLKQQYKNFYFNDKTNQKEIQ